MLKPLLVLVLLALPLAAQQQPAPQGQPQVRVNVINVCTPGPDEQKEIAAALALVPLKPSFALDFEVDRGRTQVPDAPLSHWVRLRRDFTPASPLSTVQYSFTLDTEAMVETLAFRVRDPKNVLQIILDDNVTGATGPAEVLATDTPVTHVKIERFGKSSIGLARCPADQSAYEPLFRTASRVMARYRSLLGIRRTVPVDLRLMGVVQPAPRPKAAPGKKAPSPSPEKKPPEKPAH